MDGNNQNNKINKEQILEFIRTPKGKAFLFFGIYFIFFIALSMIAHIGGKGPVRSLRPESHHYHRAQKGSAGAGVLQYG